VSSYNTGVTATHSALPHGTPHTFTIPSGVAVGDVMLVFVEAFTWTSSAPAFGTPTSGGTGSWAPIGSLTDSGASGAFDVYFQAYWKVATSGDASSTFSISFTGTPGSTDSFYWTSDLESYTGFYTAAPIGNYAITRAGGLTTITANPTVATLCSGSWGIQANAGGVNGSGTISTAPATNRHLYNPGDGIDIAVSDTNGSAGGAGSNIGGGTFTASAQSQWVNWTIELCTQAAPVAAPGGTPPVIPHPLWWQLLEVAQGRSDWQAQGVASLAQQHWRLMDGVNGRPGNGPGTATSNAGNWVPGIQFYVTQGGMWFEGYWWWVCAAGSPPTTPQKFALWSSQSNGNAGTVIPGSVVTSGTLSAGWNYVPLPTPIPIAIGGTYTAATGVNGNYPDTAGQFGSGQAYSAGITSGPLSAFGDAGGSNPPPHGSQGAFNTSNSDPAIAQPDGGAGTHDNFWLDVQVTNVAPAGYQGSYRLWPNMADADYVTAADAAVNYVIGTEIIVSQKSVVNAIWYYVPSGQGSSNNQWATSADIWNVRTGVRVATQKNPVWLKPFTGGVDGNSNSGRWVYTQLPSTVTLQPGDYYVTVYNGNGSPNGWGAKSLGYWQASTQGRGTPDGSYQKSPAAPAGITSGPLYAPSTPAASDIQDYENNSNVEPGQAVFAVGPPNQFPNRYVGGSSGGGTGPNLFQNYWVDLEVTPASTYVPDTPTPPQLPHPLFTQIVEVAALRMQPDAGTEATPPGVATITGQGSLGSPDSTLGAGETLAGGGSLGSLDSAQQAGATIAGAGSLGTPDSAVQAPATMAGAGALGVPDVTEAAPATLAGQGTLGPPDAVIAAPATIAGAGSLGTPDSAVQAPATIAGAGQLGPADVTQGATGTLAGQGTLGPPDSTIAAPATIAGQGTLAAATSPTGSGTFGGQGAPGSPAVIQGAGMTVAGQGALSGTGTSGGGSSAGAAAISGGGQFGSAAAILAVATLAGRGQLTATQLALPALGYATAPGLPAAALASLPGGVQDGTATAGTWP
jgi:hypothetical protein